MLVLNRVALSLSCMKQHQDKVDGVTGNRPTFQTRPVIRDIGENIVIVTTHIPIQQTMLIYSVPEEAPGSRTVMNVLIKLMDVTTIAQILMDHFLAVATKDTRAMANIVKVCIKQLDYELEICI